MHAKLQKESVQAHVYMHTERARVCENALLWHAQQKTFLRWILTEQILTQQILTQQILQ